jgi:phosphoglycolate phosphatase
MLIVCDLDGTLVDSGRDLAASGNALLASYGAAPLDDLTVIGMVGEGAATLVARLLNARQVPVVPDAALARFLALYDARLLDHTRPYPRIPEVLTTLTSMAVRLAVLTNKPAGATERILAGLDLRRFFEWVIGGDTPHGRKPAAAGLQWLMGEADAEPADTLMVGDSAIDLETARNAGTRVCLARYGFGFAKCSPEMFTGGELFVDTPDEIPRLVEIIRAAAGGSVGVRRTNGSSHDA